MAVRFVPHPTRTPFRDALRRQRKPGRDQRRAHPLARFGHRLVAQPDDGEGNIAIGDLHLHIDRSGFIRKPFAPNTFQEKLGAVWKMLHP